MSWAALTVADLQTALSGDELTKLSTYDLADGQADPMTEVLSQVTDEVRGWIAANSENKLGPANTLPSQLKGTAIAIARWRLAGRLSVGKMGGHMLGAPRQKEYEDATALLKDVAAGKFAVEQPETETDETIGGALPSGYGSDEQLDF